MKEDFISIKVDFAFKFVMKNKKVLRGLLGAILKINPVSITDIEFMDTHLSKNYPNEKKGILDIRIKINHEKIINIELQISPFKYWKNRTMFYNFKLFVEQGEAGSKYGEFDSCIHISILDFNLFPYDRRFHRTVQLLDTETCEIYTDKIIFHMVELRKVNDIVINEQEDELYYWCKLINSKSKEEHEMLAKKNEYIKEAVTEIEKINRNLALKQEYIKRQMALMDEESQRDSYFEAGKEQGKEEGIKQGVEEGIEQGIKQGQLDIAVKLGLSIEQIQAFTGLSLQEIEEIKKEL